MRDVTFGGPWIKGAPRDLTILFLITACESLTYPKIKSLIKKMLTFLDIILSGIC